MQDVKISSVFNLYSILDPILDWILFHMFFSVHIYYFSHSGSWHKSIFSSSSCHIFYFFIYRQWILLGIFVICLPLFLLLCFQAVDFSWFLRSLPAIIPTFLLLGSGFFEGFSAITSIFTLIGSVFYFHLSAVNIIFSNFGSRFDCFSLKKDC